MGLYTCLYEVLTPSKVVRKGLNFEYDGKQYCEFFPKQRYIKDFKHLQVKVEFSQDDLETFMRINDLYWEDLTFEMNDKLNYEIVGLFVIRVSGLNKGANSNFYRDEIWNSDNVIIRKRLEEVYELYFNGSKFKEEIIEKFAEGKMFVSFQ
jgi:hypothetical protein